MKRYMLKWNSSTQSINSLLTKYLEVVNIIKIEPDRGRALVHMNENTADRMGRDNPGLVIEEDIQHHPLQGHK